MERLREAFRSVAAWWRRVGPTTVVDWSIVATAVGTIVLVIIAVA
jgi:hypothetical protein